MTNWDFDELDELEAKFSQPADNPKAQDGARAPSNGHAHNTTEEVPKSRRTVENGKRLRVEAGSRCWE